MTTLTTFVLAALAVLLCGPDALHYAKGAPHRWGRVLHLKGDPGAVSLARMDSLDRENAALMVAEADTLHPRLVGGRCPFCVKLGQRSTVERGWTTRTLLATYEYWDEQGRHEYVDNNTTTTNYTCSRGHHWTQKE